MQISEDKMIEFWGNERFSTKLTVLNHSLNEEKFIGRMLRSVEFADEKIVLIDDRTTDKTKEIAESFGATTELFTWENDFSYPKNFLTEKVLKGWCLMLGGDMEVQPNTVKEIQEFIKDPLNVAARFQIPEYAPDDRPVVTRPRVLLWRSHPLIYWERLVHEEMMFSLYRMLQIGLPFIPSQDLPILGGERGILHYAMNVDSQEVQDNKRLYYLALYEIDRIMRRGNFVDIEDTLEFIGEKSVEDIVEKFKKGIPAGLKEAYKRAKNMPLSLEYD